MPRTSNQQPATRNSPTISNAVLIADAAWTELQAHGQGLTVDQALCRPSLMVKVCRHVRAQFPAAKEEEICQCLLNGRKHGRYTVGLRRRH
jgi:hypothetical protein